MLQAFASQRGESMVIVIWHMPTDTKLVQDALSKAKVQEFSNTFWHKTGHLFQREVSSFTNSVEMLTVGYWPCKQKCQVKMDMDPRKRHNHIEMAPVKRLLGGSDGKAINSCQKPRELMSWFCNRLSPVGGNVLVIGFGSGSEVLGAADCGRNVVGVEKDLRQTTEIQRTTLHRINAEEIAAAKAAAETMIPAKSADDSSVEVPVPAPLQVAPPEGMSETKCVDCGQLLPEDFDDSIVCRVLRTSRTHAPRLRGRSRPGWPGLQLQYAVPGHL